MAGVTRLHQNLLVIQRDVRKRLWQKGKMGEAWLPESNHRRRRTQVAKQEVRRATIDSRAG